MEQCVTPATNNQFMEFDGNVLSAQIMTCAQFATIVISTTLGTDFTGSPRQEQRGTPNMTHNLQRSRISS